jgi:membrane protein implicated in regulation of membrane protease activity
MEIVAFSIMLVIVVVAIVRVTSGRQHNEHGLQQREAARESNMILQDLNRMAEVDEIATPAKVKDDNRIIHMGREPD